MGYVPPLQPLPPWIRKPEQEPRTYRVRIVGDHPWQGHCGEIVSIGQSKTFGLPAIARVRLDDGPTVPYGHECFAKAENVMRIE